MNHVMFNVKYYWQGYASWHWQPQIEHCWILSCQGECIQGYFWGNIYLQNIRIANGVKYWQNYILASFTANIDK